jgi:hypothetical protein
MSIAEDPDTVQMPGLTFREALAQAEAQARATLPPALHERLACAVALVTQGQVLQDAETSGWWVTDRPALPGDTLVNGQCVCEDFALAPRHLCRHRLGVYLARRVVEMLAAPQDPVVAVEVEDGGTPEHEDRPDETPVPPTAAEAEALQRIPPEHIQYLHGKPFVRYAGLLAMAHAKGIVSLTAVFISVTDTLALASAQVVFKDGTTFSDAADATPQNVQKGVRPHFARLALTRAKARCLRDGLNIGVCSLEELA